MFTSAELLAIGEDRAREAINKAVRDLIVSDDGKLDLGLASPQQLKIVVHMVRQFEAIQSAAIAVRDLTVI